MRPLHLKFQGQWIKQMKRGSHAQYSDETRVKIGRYASEHGNKAAFLVAYIKLFCCHKTPIHVLLVCLHGKLCDLRLAPQCPIIAPQSRYLSLVHWSPHHAHKMSFLLHTSNSFSFIFVASYTCTSCMNTCFVTSSLPNSVLS